MKMTKNLKNAIAQGRKPTYFNNIKDAIAFAEKLVAEIGRECGVNRHGKRFVVRESWHQGTGGNANVYVARLKTHGEYKNLGALR